MSFADLVGTFGDKKAGPDALGQFKTMIAGAEPSVRAQAYEHIGAIVEAVGNKDKGVSKAGIECLEAVFEEVGEWEVIVAMPPLKVGIEGKAKPVTKEAVLNVLDKLAKKYPKSVGREIEWLVDPVAFCLNDVKKEVTKAAKNVMISLCEACGNKDIQPFIPTVVKANEAAKNVPECVEALAGCIFVQNVEAPALAVMVPVLWRGLNDKSEVVKRRCCVIIDNMCKLVDDPREGSPLMPTIKPLVEKAGETISDPEARDKANETLATIMKLAEAEIPPPSDFGAVCENNEVSSRMWKPDFLKFLNLCANGICRAQLCVGFDLAPWKSLLGKWIDDAKLTAIAAEMANAGAVEEDEFIDEDEECPDLYKGSFSLATGTLTMLRDTKLHLKKFKFYGMVGPNGCGKTTLMKAISQEQVEGFPKRDELRTVFVAHEIPEEEVPQEDGSFGPSKAWPLGKFNIDLSGIDFVVHMCNVIYGMTPKLIASNVEKALGEIGFKNHLTGVNPKAAANMCNPITTYSGGWKVKMQLAAAQLMDADILMLDEPTGHLDVKNIAWMKDWLRAFRGSIIAVSADRFFLEEMATHMIWFEERKLRQFKGVLGTTLSQWVEKFPQYASFFELSDKNMKFTFPAPGPLEGVKSKGRSILKMTKVTFKYPTHEVNTVQDIDLSVCMLSRVAVIGANGAGKSTAIKLLIGEIKADSGIVWKHSGLRMAYVAQHAFHHLEKHTDKTPVNYILWRFAGNDDRESQENQTKDLNVDEEALRKVPWCVDPKSGVVRKCVPGEKGDVPVTPDQILNRRKNKAKKYEYEVKWMYKPIDATVWVERDTLLNMGYEKIVCREDEKQAAAAGLMQKMLTAPTVEKHLKDFGVSVEEASHSPIGSMAGGQKVKVVLAGAMWMCPHILILDEPTNYLDRDALGALVKGLQEFGGGVVIISHNREFADSICTEKWIMDAGRLAREGEVVGEDVELDAGLEAPDEIVDASGNVVKVNKVKTMTDKERKKAIKEIEKKLKENKKKDNLSEAEVWELDDKLAELKNELGS